MTWPITKMFLSEVPSLSSTLRAGRHLLWSNSSVVEKRNQQYGPLERHQVDIYEPSESDREAEPVVFIHGGGWETGSKDLHKFIGRSWARKDFILAMPNYRLAPQTTYPGQLQDITRCIRWLRQNYSSFSNSLYLAGHSAGAHMASLVGFARQWREEAKITEEEIQGLILLAGVYKFYPFEKADPRIRRFLGEQRYWKEAQPINYLTNSLPPVFLGHGRRDAEVSPEQSTHLRDKLEELGVRNELLLEEEVGHLELLLDTAREESRFRRSLSTFLEKDKLN